MVTAATPTVFAVGETYPGSVRVKLTTNNATSIVMNVTGEYFIDGMDSTFRGGSLTLRSVGGTITATHSEQGEIYSGTKFTIKRVKLDPSAGNMYFNSRRYLGHFNIKLLSSGYIQVVNEVPLAHYLYGVVAYEMNNSYPLDALKAQAIAAKCYVISDIMSKPDAEYHIGDTSSDQVYKGYNSSYTNVINAVDSTINQFVTVNGKLLRTYYAASNGGETNLISYAWSGRGADTGYGISIDDYDFQNSSAYKETVKIPINSQGTVTQQLYNLLIAKATAAVGMEATGIAGIKAAEAHTPKYAGTQRNMTYITVVADVNTAVGMYTDVNLTFPATDLYTYGAVSNANLRTYWGQYSSDGSYYYIYHVRWGHGVGLSQRGAQARAKAGHNYSQILAYYYPGASLTTADITKMSEPVKPGALADRTPIGTGKTTATVYIREDASTQATAIRLLGRRETMVIYEEYGDWYLAKADKDNAEGWVYKKYVTFSKTVPTPSPTPSPTPNGSDAIQTPAPVSYGYCTGDGVNFREGPGTSHKSIKRIDKNTELSVIKTEGGWYYALCEGDYGYISASYVKITAQATPAPTPSETPAGTPDPEATPTPRPEAIKVQIGLVTTSGVNFREGPGTSYTSLKKLSRDTGLIIFGKTGNWYNVEAGDLKGYIFDDYVKITGETYIRPEGSAETTPEPDDEGDETENDPATPDYGTGLTTGSVNFRKGIGTSSALVKSLKKNTTLMLYELKNGWYRAKLEDGTEGWVSSKYVKVVIAIPEKSETDTDDSGESATVTGYGETTAQVNFREGPNTSSKVIVLLERRTKVTLYELKDGWYSADVNGKKGYIIAKYVKVTAEAPKDETDGEKDEEKPNEEGGIVPEGTGSVAASGLVLPKGEATANVNFRTKAGTGSGSAVLETIAAGTSFDVIGECGDFYYIIHKGRTGYVYKAYARIKSSGNTELLTVGDTLTLAATSTTADVNLRTGPGTEHDKIKELKKGSSVMVYLIVNDWCLVAADGVYGYAVCDYIKLS